MDDKNNGAGRPFGSKSAPAAERTLDSIEKRIAKYFCGPEFIEDMKLGKAGKDRMDMHERYLPYILAKKAPEKDDVQTFITKTQRASRVKLNFKKNDNKRYSRED